MILLKLQKTFKLSFNKIFVVSLLSTDQLLCINHKPIKYFFNTTKKLFGQRNNPTTTQQQQ